LDLSVLGCESSQRPQNAITDFGCLEYMQLIEQLSDCQLLEDATIQKRSSSNSGVTGRGAGYNWPQMPCRLVVYRCFGQSYYLLERESSFCCHVSAPRHQKVKLPLCSTNYALRHAGEWGSGCIDPRFLDLGTSSRSGHFTQWIGWVGPRASGRYGEVKILYFSGNRTPTPLSSSL
jgi:hypothetical protein